MQQFDKLVRSAEGPITMGRTQRMLRRGKLALWLHFKTIALDSARSVFGDMGPAIVRRQPLPRGVPLPFWLGLPVVKRIAVQVPNEPDGSVLCGARNPSNDRSARGECREQDLENQ